jgi:adenylate cyclase
VSDEPQRADLGGVEAAAKATVAPDDLERAIIGDEPTLTAEQLVAAAGCTLPDARRLWRALGFAEVDESAPVFTAADRDAIMLLTWLIDSGALDFDTAIRLTRAVGHTMARLADWQVSTLSEYVEGLEEAGRGTGSRLTTGLDMIRSVEPPFEELMMYAYRRHLAAAVTRVEALGAQDSDLHTKTVTVGFADMVSFTRLSNGMDQDQLADIVEDFESACSDQITRHGARLIKTLGDSVLFICDTPEIGVDVASDIVEEIGGDAARPDVHVGLATGPVVMRVGDVFGPPVNMASRLTGVARRNRVICDVVTAEALRDVPGVVLRPLTDRAVRGFGVVTPVAVRRMLRGRG